LYPITPHTCNISFYRFVWKRSTEKFRSLICLTICISIDKCSTRNKKV